jgi:hypothetical protein
MKSFKKVVFTAVIAIITSFTVTAQTPGACGTQLSDLQKSWLLDYAQNGRGAAQKQGAQYYVPIYFHIVGDDAGKGFYSANQLMLDLCELNRRYVSVGFYFYLAGTDYISNTTYYDHNYNSGYAMMNKYNKANVANVYMVLNPAGNCGYFAPGANGVAIGKNCAGTGATTVTHELGHFFSLPHPFDNVTGVKEYVNGTNCSVAGDLFCDTRADFLNARWPCPYKGNDTDPLGDTYNPDQTLYMSYSSDNCQNRFSDEQISAMQYNINSQRSNLRGPVQDTAPAMQRPQQNWPKANDTYEAGNVTFAWNSVPGAKFYVVQCTPFSVYPSSIPVDMITTDTFFKATTLVNNKTYRWRVRAIYPGQTCTEFTESVVFTTSATTAVKNYQADKTIALYPNPAQNGQQVFVAVEQAIEGNLQATIYTIDGKAVPAATLTQQSNQLYTIDISSLQAGFYFVDITNGQQVYRKKLFVE